MSPRDFAPANPSKNSIFLALTLLGSAGVIAVAMTMASSRGLVAPVDAIIAGTVLLLAIRHFTLGRLRKADAKNGRHACANASLKTFWREDLERVQDQPIRVERAASGQTLAT